jgi:hypothetical protein
VDRIPGPGIGRAKAFTGALSAAKNGQYAHSAIQHPGLPLEKLSLLQMQGKTRRRAFCLEIGKKTTLED